MNQNKGKLKKVHYPLPWWRRSVHYSLPQIQSIAIGTIHCHQITKNLNKNKTMVVLPHFPNWGNVGHSTFPHFILHFLNIL